jgi:acyl-CoA synthetase (AMP-forming)/AMP-acid ligase II
MNPDTKFRTVTEVIAFRGATQPEKTAFIFLENGETEQARLTFGDLDRRARGIAARLQRLAQPGERVLLVYPPGLEFICAWVGCLYAGLIGVPAYAPRRHRPADRLKAIVADATPVVALTDAATLDGLTDRADGYSDTLELYVLATDQHFDAPAEQWRAPDITPQTLALLQYTSGSTGTPKGVMISHANILSNMAVIAEASDADASTVFVSWLPVFHDMGFFGKVLLPIHLGVLSVLMAPAAFVQRPVRWLQAITNYRATHCAAPDFAYDLCARKVSDDARAQLDLGSWKVAFNGAEPVRAESVARFSRVRRMRLSRAHHAPRLRDGRGDLVHLGAAGAFAAAGGGLRRRRSRPRRGDEARARQAPRAGFMRAAVGRASRADRQSGYRRAVPARPDRRNLADRPERRRGLLEARRRDGAHLSRDARRRCRALPAHR